MDKEAALEVLRNRQEKTIAPGSGTGCQCMGKVPPIVPLLKEWPFPFTVFSFMICFGYLCVINTILFLTFLIS